MTDSSLMVYSTQFQMSHVNFNASQVASQLSRSKVENVEVKQQVVVTRQTRKAKNTEFIKKMLVADKWKTLKELPDWEAMALGNFTQIFKSVLDEDEFDENEDKGFDALYGLIEEPARADFQTLIFRLMDKSVASRTHVPAGP